MSRSDAERLEDIRAAISRCITYRDHLDSAELGSMAYDAVLRNLAVIGEAVKSLPNDFKLHEYFRVNPDMIRDIVDNQLAPLLDDIG